MAVNSVLNKNLYTSALAGVGGTTAKTPTTGGIYANGIAGLNPSIPKVSPNVGVIGGSVGGVSGGVTKEGAIIGGATGNLERMPTIGSGVGTGSNVGGTVAGGLGVTKFPSVNSTLPKYSDFLNQFQSQQAAKAAQNASANITSGQQPQTQEQTTQPEGSTGATEENKTPVSYEEYLEQQRELLDKRKAEADRQAEAAKERAAVDAQASYAQNMAGYGANAEALAQMGLQGGGYSDYVNAQAYAQKRADMQQANVTEAAAKAQNNATYEDALSSLNQSGIEYSEKKAEKQEGIYASLWEGALNPNSGYTEESIAAIGREYGLSETQIQELQQLVSATRTKAENEKNAALKQGALDAINQGSLNESNLDSYLDSLKGMGASDKDIDDIRESYQSNYFNDYMSQISNGNTLNTKEVDDAYKAGNLSQEHYESLKKAWNDDINTASNAFDRYDSYEAAKRDYEDILSNSWCSEETKAALKKAFDGYEAKKFESNVNSGYNAHSSTVTLNTPNGKVTVTYGVNSKSLKKSSGNAVFESDVYKNAKSGQVFIVNGRPYVKLDNGDLGWVNDYLGQGAFEKLLNTYKGTVYDIS